MNTNHHQDFVNIGLNIMYYRKKKGFTQAELADLIFYSSHHLQQVEKAEENPSVELLLDIAKVLEIPVTRLFEER